MRAGILQAECLSCHQQRVESWKLKMPTPARPTLSELINARFLMDEALLSLRQFYDIGTLTAKAVYCDCLTQILIHFLQTGDITLHNETKSYGHVQRLLDQQLKP